MPVLTAQLPFFKNQFFLVGATIRDLRLMIFLGGGAANKSFFFRIETDMVLNLLKDRIAYLARLTLLSLI